jgi:hypothetical protein
MSMPVACSRVSVREDSIVMLFVKISIHKHKSTFSRKLCHCLRIGSFVPFFIVVFSFGEPKLRIASSEQVLPMETSANGC